MRIARDAGVAGAVILLAVTAWAGASVKGPVPVSPGFATSRPDITDRCPTFNWTGSLEAESVELLVYEVPEVAMGAAPAEPRGWTVRSESSLGGWSEWAEPRLFRVVTLPSAVEVEEAAAVLRDYLKHQSPGEEPAPEGGPSRREPPPRRPPGPGDGPERGTGESVRGLELQAGIYAPLAMNPSLVIEGGLQTGGAIEALGGLQSAADLTVRNALFKVSDTLTATVALNAGLGVTSLGLGAFQLSEIAELGGSVGVGTGAAQSLLVGFDNSLLGSMAAGAMEIGDGNSVMGANALGDCVGSFAGPACDFNTVIGSHAADVCTDCSGNVIIGADAGGALESAHDSIFVGARAGSLITDTIGSVVIGVDACASLTQAHDSILIGRDIAPDLISATNSVLIGSITSLISATQSVIIGSVLPQDIHEASNNVLIGASIGAGNVISNTIRIGDDTHQDLVIPAMINAFQDGPSIQVNPGTAKLGQPMPSSRRFKEEIRDMAGLSAGVLSLRPVVFRYRPEVRQGPRPVEFGLIAEEVAEIFPDLVYYDAAGKPFSVSYKKLTPMLVNELQRQERLIETQQRMLVDQKRELQRLLERLERVERHR